jgi:hypothetical protein
MLNLRQSQMQMNGLTTNSLCGIVQGDWHISPASRNTRSRTGAVLLEGGSGVAGTCYSAVSFRMRAEYFLDYPAEEEQGGGIH